MKERDLHQIRLMETATRLGMVYEDFLPVWGVDAVEYRKGGQKRLVFDGRSYPTLSANAADICNDKQLTKHFFKRIGIPFPASVVFHTGMDVWEIKEREKLIGQTIHAGRAYVCKPLLGTDGHAVGMHLRNLADVEAHLSHYLDQYDQWMLEEQVAGEDLRIQVIGGRLVAACRRVPAFVVGDGQATLAQLIERLNTKIQAQNPHNRLVVDEATRQLMEAQSVDWEMVIGVGREIQLKYVSNMGQGGLAIDVTDILHPQYSAWATALSEAIGIGTFAFDLLCTDPSGDPRAHAQALELNPRAQWLHHTFSEVRQHDIPQMILTMLFEE